MKHAIHAPQHRAEPGAEAGFMMLDILIGLATIAILAGMVFPFVVREEMNKREGLVREEIQLIGDALQLYYYEHGQYPEDFDDQIFQTRFVRATLGESGLNDQWGANVRYKYVLAQEDGEAPTVTLFSRGPNGIDEEGEGDDIQLLVSSDLPATKITSGRLQVIRVAIRNIAPIVRWEYESGEDTPGTDDGGGTDDSTGGDDTGGSDGTCPDSGDDDEELVTICHRPPGNPDAGHEITINLSALPAHLAHGDTLGSCSGSDEDPPPTDGAGEDDGIGGPQLIFEPATLIGDWALVDRDRLGLGAEYDNDGWGTPFISVAGTLSVFSAGPDRIPYTADDITF